MRRVRSEVLDESRGGMWPWRGQRVAAVAVSVTSMGHLVLTRYCGIGELTYYNIAGRLAAGSVLVNDVVLLLAVVYHALNGVRMVVLDWWVARRASRVALDVVLWAVGVAAVVYGIWALWVWVS